RFQQKIDPRRGQPDDRLPEVRGESGRTIARLVARRGDPARARVPVRDQTLGMLNAEGEVGLQPESSDSAAQGVIAGRNQEREPGRKCVAGFTAAHELVAIVDGSVAPARTRSLKTAGMRGHERDTKLVLEGTQGPFVGLSVDPVAAVGEPLESA